MSTFSKPSTSLEGDSQPPIFARECKPTSSVMPLPSTLVSGDKRAKPYKRDAIKFKGPEANQNDTIENLQKDLTKLAFSACCSKSKFNSCLHSAFSTNGGDFDFTEAKKCYTHYHNQYCNLSIIDWKLWCYQEFIKCCYGIDDSGNIINGFDLCYGSILQKKKVRVGRKVWSYCDRYVHSREYGVITLSSSYNP